MAVLYGITTAPDGYRNLVSGYLMFENLVDSGTISVADEIYNDYDAITTGSLTPIALAAVYCPIVFTTFYPEYSTQIYGGEPSRLKLGTLTTKHLNLYGYKEFITYEQQIFKNKLCLVNPTPIDFPPDMSALPPFEQFSFFSLSSWRFNATTPGLWNEWFSADKLVYDLASGVIANIGFYYVCYRVFPSSIPPNWTVPGI